MNDLPSDPRNRPLDEDKAKSPNRAIDKALKDLMKKAKDDNLSPDTWVKIITAAISWEKVKNAITDKDDEFDPDKL